VVILTDRLDRIGEAIAIAQRARRIAVESIVAGMGLSLVAMLAATVGWLQPVPAAIVQEVIDVAVILNALRALTPAHRNGGRRITMERGRELHHDHLALVKNLDRLRAIVDTLDDAVPGAVPALITEANELVQERYVTHERDDEGSVYPRLTNVVRERHSLSAMSRAHREILHLARLLARVAEDLPSEKIDRYLIRDAQRAIEAIQTLVRMHTAQEEDVYEAVGGTGRAELRFTSPFGLVNTDAPLHAVGGKSHGKPPPLKSRQSRWRRFDGTPQHSRHSNWLTYAATALICASVRSWAIGCIIAEVSG
jgi:Hemerythrin HHE cation binding domain